MHWHVDAGGWKYVGTSSNNLYVTLAQPMSDARLESFFDISCKAAKGQTTQDGTFEAIWEQGGFGAALNVKNVRGEQLGYYRNRGSCFEGCPYTTAQELVVHADGQCGAWQHLLVCCARAQGIMSAQPVEVTPDPSVLPVTCSGGPADGFLVKNWDFASGQGTSGCTNYPFKFDACGDYWHRWPGGSEVADITGVVGQDCANPLAWFPRHQIVLYDERYYDPSYGTGPFTGSPGQAALALEQGAIDGYYGFADANGGDYLAGARKDVHSVREIRFSQ